MSSIVIAYEDQYCGQLHLLVKALRRDRQLPAIVLEPRPVRGTGNFVDEAPKLLRAPLKQTRMPPNRVVCVGDADRPPNLVPGAPPAPVTDDIAALDAWVIELERLWRERLIADCKLTDEQSSRLVTCCIRWSKESALISCHEALLAHVDTSRENVAAVLDACVPPPATLGDGEFVARYRRPDECLDRVFEAMSGRGYKKGRDDEDLLEKIRGDATRRGECVRRCPDLGRLVSMLVF